MTAKKSKKKHSVKKSAAKKSKQAAGRKAAVKRAAAAPVSLQEHADTIRHLVHASLKKAGLHGVSLQSIQFAAIPECGPGQHAEKVCNQTPGGIVCTWQCVDN
jgi:hypothetical protein